MPSAFAGGWWKSTNIPRVGWPCFRIAAEKLVEGCDVQQVLVLRVLKLVLRLVNLRGPLALFLGTEESKGGHDDVVELGGTLTVRGWPFSSHPKKGDSPHGESSPWRVVLVSSTPQIHASSSIHFRHPALPGCGVFVSGKLLVRAGGSHLAGSLADDSRFPVDDGWLGFCGSDSVSGDRPMDRCGAHSLSVVLHSSPRADALRETPTGADDPRKPSTAGGLDDIGEKSFPLSLLQ